MSVLMVPDDGDELWPSLGPLVCDWIEDNLCFGPGDLRGEPAVIDEEKRGLIYRMYEIYPEGHEMAGRRRFKRVGLSLAKGLAKTELLAWIASAELHHQGPVRCVGWEDGEPIGGPVTDPYIPLVAYTEEQSDELAYGALRVILEHSMVAEDFDIGVERIMRRDGSGKAVSLSGSPNARDGARTTFQGFDESHRMTSEKLKRAHSTMLANIPKRMIADAWSLEVTTAYAPGEGSVAESTMDYARAIADGRAKHSQMFFFHRQADDKHDLKTESGARAAIIEASGSHGLFRDIGGIVELWRDPTTDKTYWERVWCNRPTQGESKAFDLALFKGLEKDIEVPDGSTIVIGFDGAQFRDATALVATHVPTGHQWVAGAWEKPYSQNREQEWQVPADEVDACVDDLFKRFNVWRMYADPPYWESKLSEWQGRYGDKRVIEWWTNRNRQMSAAIQSFSTALKEGSLGHSGDEVLVRHIGNVFRKDLPQLDERGEPFWVMRKERPDSPNKIDAAMAAVLSWEARTDAIALGVGEDHVYSGVELADILED